ncbi:nucleic acid/nucleotide deaminase domain-containing protein [Streptomyces maoxianensis]|uniref:Nucleic acid/nucleotide deaminase domain-containing protein n=1 Tax=Streptomyces maoxianensis TaxID=1459942 RepID=A0ABV9GEJ9_9ACTN
MGMTLPDDLVAVLDLVGVDWPQIDEDEVKASAKGYRKLGEGIRDAVKEGNDACSHIVAGKSKGATVTAIDRRWGKLTTRDLATFANGCDDLAAALEECADLILGCKIAIVADLTTAAAAATAGVVGMFFTFGASGLVSAAAIGIARVAVHEAIDYAIGQITSIVTEKIEAKILAEIEKLFTDRLGGGGTYDVMAPGGADMAQDLVIEFDEFDRAAGDYQKTATNFGEKKGEFKAGGASRKTSVKKDSRFHKLGTVMDKAEDAVDKKADEMVKTLEDHGGKIDKSKKDQKGTDDDTKAEIDKCKTHDGDDTPMYLLSADGSVQELHADGSRSDVQKSDKSGIWNVMEKDGTVWRPPKGTNPYPIPNTRSGPKVVSQKIAPGSTDLSRATEIARFAKGDYGGTNFAAAEYVNPKTGKPIILVGDSEGPHSERTIGYPVLRHNEEANISRVYTEREPCQKSPKCDQWLDEYFKSKNPNLQVEHANSYDQTLSAKDPDRDREHRDYMRDLKKLHQSQGHP